jgi:transposase
MKESFQPLTDAEWEVIKTLLNDQPQRFYDLGLIFNILFWIVWTGSQWRAIDRVWGLPWQRAYYYFGKWKGNHRLLKGRTGYAATNSAGAKNHSFGSIT